MKYLKYIILIVVFIIIVIIGILLKVLNGDKPHVYEGPVEEPQYSIELNRIVSDVAIKNYYYDVKNIVEKYYSYFKPEKTIVYTYLFYLISDFALLFQINIYRFL